MPTGVISDKGSITVIGAGSWGTALAILLARNGVSTRLWGHDKKQIQQLQKARINKEYLPGAAFPPQLQPVTKLTAALDDAENILIAVPSSAFREVLQSLLNDGRHFRICWATKGFSNPDGRLLHELVSEIFPAVPATAVLSGPTFAAEVAAGLPAAITVASEDDAFSEILCQQLHNDRFRVYTAHDIIGVSIGGAAKNIYAIAAGIADGLGFGANTRAALITRALSELMRLGTAAGGKQETFMGLTGLGDLILTCTDNQSRNRRFGLSLARGQSTTAALKDIHQVVEGREAARHILDFARRFGIEMPIAEEIHAVLFANKPPGEAVQTLLSRERRMESP